MSQNHGKKLQQNESSGLDSTQKPLCGLRKTSN